MIVCFSRHRPLPFGMVQSFWGGPITSWPFGFPSDLTDEEWDRIAPLMLKPGRRERPREVDFREVINAVRHLVR